MRIAIPIDFSLQFLACNPHSSHPRHTETVDRKRASTTVNDGHQESKYKIPSAEIIVGIDSSVGVVIVRHRPHKNPIHKRRKQRDMCERWFAWNYFWIWIKIERKSTQKSRVCVKESVWSVSIPIDFVILPYLMAKNMEITILNTMSQFPSNQAMVKF